MRIRKSCKSKVANLEIAILVDENVRRLEISVNDSGRVNVFQPSLYIEKWHEGEHGRETRIRNETERTRIW